MTDDRLTFTFDGTARHARPGQTAGAALLAGGTRSWRVTRSLGRPRGIFCGIGACFDCLADINDDDAVRACLVRLHEGDQVRTSRSVAAPPPGDASPQATTSAPGQGVTGADVAVVGAGPAGLAAALAAAGLGCTVVLVDSGPAAGGQIYRQAQATADSTGPAAPSVPGRLLRATGHPRIRHFAETTVWHAAAGGAWPAGKPGENEPPGAAGRFSLWLTEAAGRAARPGLLQAQAVVVATGATELVLPFPGWDLPGVTTAGAAQALLKGHHVTVGKRVLVAGSGPLLLPATAALARAGVRVTALLESTPLGASTARAPGLARFPAKLREAAGYAAVLARHRVPVRTGRAVVACHGSGRVQEATVAKVDRDWRPLPGTADHVPVDAVHVSFGFSPSLELARQLGCTEVPQPAAPVSAVWHDADMATSVDGVFAAGEATGVAGARVAELEGYLAGAAAARYLGRVSAGSFTARTRGIRASLARDRRFAALLGAIYPFPGGDRSPAGWLNWLEPDTVICRCEEVPWSAIGQAVAAGARNVRGVRGLTRCGMGYCQGRVCGPILQAAVAAAAGLPLADVGDLHARPVATPVTLGAIAGAAP
jgi:NADPH-dependent 2,4-dienoyl-CoA reductase/sulfur reductase-like enzyme